MSDDYTDFDLSALTAPDTGIDAFFDDSPKATIDFRDPSVPEVPNTIRVANLRDLSGFRRVANDTLIRKSEHDLWKLREREGGGWEVERLFDADGNPLKAG
jgi:hypothetical protein